MKKTERLLQKSIQNVTDSNYPANNQKSTQKNLEATLLFEDLKRDLISNREENGSLVYIYIYIYIYIYKDDPKG